MSGARRGELHLMRHLLVTCVVAACMCGAAAARGRGDVTPTILIAAPLAGIGDAFSLAYRRRSDQSPADERRGRSSE